jgi:prophage regulatory protein
VRRRPPRTPKRNALSIRPNKDTFFASQDVYLVIIMVDELDAPLAGPAFDRFVPEHECKSISSLPRSTRWRLIRDGKFPPPVQVSPGRIAWRLSDLTRWMNDRPVTTASASATTQRLEVHA